MGWLGTEDLGGEAKELEGDFGVGDDEGAGACDFGVEGVGACGVGVVGVCLGGGGDGDLVLGGDWTGGFGAGGRVLVPGDDDVGDEDPPLHLSLLQSTGLLTTGKHVFGSFCLGLLGKQLLPSSNATSACEEGTQASSSLVK